MSSRQPCMFNPTLYFYECHYGQRRVRVRAEGRFAAREKARAYFKVAFDKISVVRV